MRSNGGYPSCAGVGAGISIASATCSVREDAETLVLEHDYDAAPEEVFAAWTNVDTLQLWFGCAADKLWTVHEWDVRVGGSIHVSLDFGKDPFVVKGEFLILDPPYRLRYLWAGDEIVDVTIGRRRTGSSLRLAHTFPSNKRIRPFITAGWSYSLDQLGHF
jgi:Uncharacterized conserved protein